GRLRAENLPALDLQQRPGGGAGGGEGVVAQVDLGAGAEGRGGRFQDRRREREGGRRDADRHPVANRQRGEQLRLGGDAGGSAEVGGAVGRDRGGGGQGAVHGQRCAAVGRDISAGQRT